MTKKNTQTSEPVAKCNQSHATFVEAGLGEIIIYNPDDSIKLNVWMERESVWLTIKQLAQLFDRDRTVIGRHIKNIDFFIKTSLPPVEGSVRNGSLCP